jgi:hypothetical protein
MIEKKNFKIMTALFKSITLNQATTPQQRQQKQVQSSKGCKKAKHN